MSDRDDFSHRKTAPSGTAVPGYPRGLMPRAVDPKKTIQPTGEERPPFNAHDARRESEAQTKRDEEEDPISSMIDGVLPKDPVTAVMFKQLNRIARAQATLATTTMAHDKAIKDLQAGAPTRYVSPLPRSYGTGAVSMSTPPMANPDREGDVLIAMRTKVPSFHGEETDDERADRLEKEVQQGNAKVGSLTLALENLQVQVANMQKAAPAVAVAAGAAAGEAATKAATSEISRVLTNKNFTTAAATIATVIASIFGASAYQSHRQDQTAKEQTEHVERAAKEGAKEAKTDGPNVFIVHDGQVQAAPVPSASTSPYGPKKKD